MLFMVPPLQAPEFMVVLIRCANYPLFMVSGHVKVHVFMLVTSVTFPPLSGEADSVVHPSIVFSLCEKQALTVEQRSMGCWVCFIGRPGGVLCSVSVGESSLVIK